MSKNLYESRVYETVIGFITLTLIPYKITYCF